MAFGLVAAVPIMLFLVEFSLALLRFMMIHGVLGLFGGDNYQNIIDRLWAPRDEDDEGGQRDGNGGREESGSGPGDDESAGGVAQLVQNVEQEHEEEEEVVEEVDSADGNRAVAIIQRAEVHIEEITDSDDESEENNNGRRGNAERNVNVERGAAQAEARARARAVEEEDARMERPLNNVDAGAAGDRGLDFRRVIFHPEEFDVQEVARAVCYHLRLV